MSPGNFYAQPKNSGLPQTIPSSPQAKRHGAMRRRGLSSSTRRYSGVPASGRTLDRSSGRTLAT